MNIRIMKGNYVSSNDWRFNVKDGLIETNFDTKKDYHLKVMMTGDT